MLAHSMCKYVIYLALTRRRLTESVGTAWHAWQGTQGQSWRCFGKLPLGSALTQRRLTGRACKLQGMHGMWELAVNRANHDDLVESSLLGIVGHLSSPDLQVLMAPIQHVLRAYTCSS